MTRRALVLGAGGFLGSHLCRRLLSSGWDVTGVVRDPQEPHVIRRLGASVNDMRVVTGDALDAELIASLVRSADAVFPFAGMSGASDSMAVPEADLEANGRAQLVLLETIRAQRPQARVVFPGSRLQYGRIDVMPVTEEHPQLPTSIYGIHKLLGEQYHRLYARAFGLSTTVLRISNPYGPHQDRPGRNYGIVGTFMSRAADNRPIRLYGGGNQLREYLFIDDLTRLIEIAATHPAAVGEVFNASGLAPTSLRQMAAAVISVVGSGELLDCPWPDDAAAVETGDYVGSSAKASRLLGWQAQVPLLEGLARTWAEFRMQLTGTQ